MFKTAVLAAASALALAAAIPAHAQTRVLGIDRLDDQIDDITRDAQRDLDDANDAARYSPLGVVQGVRGSAALTASGTSGNTDTGDLSFAGRISVGRGEWTHLFGFSGELGETDGDRDKGEFYGIYEGSRAINEQLYAFGTGRYQYDRFGANRNDVFLGGGLGYRIVNTPDLAWRVQGGPGVRYLKRADSSEDTELAGIASSRFYYGFTETVSLTNDTDLLYSDEATDITNDFGVNFRINDTFSTRISYLTDYTSAPVDDLKNTDNTIGLSLVVGF